MNKLAIRLVIVAIALAGMMMLSGCMAGTEYTVSTSEPQTGDIFGEITEAEIHEGWSTYADISGTYSINGSWIGPDGNWSGPDGSWSASEENWTDSVTIKKIRIDNGSPEQDARYELEPDEYDWQEDFSVPNEGDMRKYQLRAEINGTTLDYLNITVREND